MSDVESISTISASDSDTTIRGSEGKSSRSSAVKQVANGGKRWTSEQLHMLWAHRMLFPIKEDKQKNVAPLYQIVADRIGKTNTACRIKIFHVKRNVRKGVISLEDALAGKHLPLQDYKKARKRAAEKGAVSPKRAPSGKKAPVSASKARKQTAAEKRESSPEDTPADEPLSSQTSQPQKQAAAEKRVRSPKGAFAGKLLAAFTHAPRKRVSAEKRASSPEDALAKAPLPSQLSKSRRQAAAERSASSLEAPRAEGIQSGQASMSQEYAPTESRAGSPEDALSEEPQSCPVCRPQQQASVEDASRFRSADGGRVAPRHTPVEMDAATALLDLSQASWGSMTVTQRSHALGEQLSLYNIQSNQE